MDLKVWEAEWISEYIESNGLELTRQFVDVGAGDGLHQSISRKFILEGWSAFLIDGLSENIKKCRKLYQDFDKVDYFSSVVSDEEGLVCFEENKSHWSLSKVGVGESVAQSVRLSRLLEYFKIVEIGIMSIDIEGMETEVIKDLLNNNIHPEIMIVEANEPLHLEEHKSLLLDKYHLAGGILPNYFYVRRDLLRKS